MMIPIPKITLLCPSYNHGKYIGSLIQSILNQSEQRFELLVIDDCSTDDNLSEILKFSDPRIRLIQHTFNQGISAGINQGIREARADIIALLASDDLARFDYLEKVLAAFEEHPEISAVYVALQHIDQEGDLLSQVTHLPVDFSRLEILKRSFFGENQLPSPGMVVRKQAGRLAEIPVGSIQYSDWIFHNKLLFNHEVYLLNEPLIFYRVTSGSVSSRSAGVVAREKLETSLLMDYFLEIGDVSTLQLIFGADLHAFGKPSPEMIPYFLSRMALNSPIWEKRNWGYLTLARFISEPNIQEMLHTNYGFDYKTFMALTPIPDCISGTEITSNKQLRLMKKKFLRLTRVLVALVLFLLITVLLLYFS